MQTFYYLLIVSKQLQTLVNSDNGKIIVLPLILITRRLWIFNFKYCNIIHNFSIQMSDPSKLIQQFLQKNGLIETLKAFKSQSKRATSHQKTTSTLNNIHKLALPNDQESQNKIREYLQKADAKYLKRFVEKMRRAPKDPNEDMAQLKLREQKFFQKLVEKERQNYELYKQNMIMNMNTPQFLDESRYYENEWEGENDLGFQIYEFPMSDLPKVIREIQSMQSVKNYENTAIKEVPFPEVYYSTWHQIKDTHSYNTFDKMPTKLPPNVVFDNKKSESSEIYPLQSEGIVFDSHELKLIYDREKTGFEEERQMTIVINEVLAGRFQIVSVLGQAQFSKAIEVKDLTATNQKQRYCLKMILNNKDYMDQALDEVKLLRYIKANCNPDQACLINMHDYFYHREHLMILTELLKQNLYEAYRSKPEFFSLSKLQLIAKQILTALATLHKLHIIHCDLKPENILIKSYTNCLVKVIDIGSSVFFHDEAQFYVQTRSYRAPEVIIGCEYTEKIDVWSLGCIIAELYTGQVLFQSDNVVGMLARIQGLRGPWPSWMIQTGKEIHKYFTKQLVLFEQICQEVGQEVDGKRKKRKTGFCRIFTPKMTNLKSRIKSNNKNFIDFLSKCLKIDPSARLSAKQALSHPFITEPIQDE